MAITAQEASNFYHSGRDTITKMAQAVDSLESYARTFEVRGGSLDMGQEFGPDTEAMVVFWNALRDFLAANNGQNQSILDKYRADF